MTFSGFSDVDAAPDPRTYVDRLDRTGATALWRSIKRRVIQHLDVQAGDRILDVGCGTGDDARGLARLVGPTGRVVGVDRSATMLVEAQARSHGADGPVGFCRGDAGRLPFKDASFTACRAERVLQHLDAPRDALAEMVRVTGPRGRLVVVEPDYGTLVIQGADAALTRRVLAFRRAHFRDASVGRHLSAWLRDLGMCLLDLSLLTNQRHALDPGDEASLRRTYVDPMVGAGALDPTEGQRWLSDLAGSATEGRYRYAVTIFLVSARNR